MAWLLAFDHTSDFGASLLPRILVIGGIVFTAVTLLLTLRTAKRESRVRPGMDIGRIVIGAVALVVMGVFTGVQTPLLLAFAGIVAGALVGYFQGTGLEVFFKEGRLSSRRTLIAIAVWAAGIVAMQVAGLLNRTGVFRIGQTIALFGIFTGLGLFIGRRRPMAEARTKQAAMAGAALALLIPLAALALTPMLAASAQTLSDDEVCDLTPRDGYWSIGPGGADAELSVLGIVNFEVTMPFAISGCSNTFELDDGALVHTAVYLMPSADVGATEISRVAAEATPSANFVGVLGSSRAGEVLGEGAVRIDFEFDILWFAQVGPFIVAGHGEKSLDSFVPASETMIERMGESIALVTPLAGLPGEDPGTITTEGTTGTTEAGSDTTVADPGTAQQPPATTTSEDDDPLGWLTEGEITPDEALASAIAAVAAAVAVGALTLAEGQQTIADLIEEARRGGWFSTGPGGTGLVDEYGDTLLPRADGLYPWDDGTSVRWVSHAEAEELIARARTAQAANALDEQARLARHRANADADWQRYTEDFRRRIAAQRAARARAEAARKAAFARGERLRDVIGKRAGDPVYDRMLDRLERDPSPSDEDFWTMRGILATTMNDEAAIEALGDKGVIRMTMEGIQEDTAWLAEKGGELMGQPFLGKVAGWIVRNPEMPARIAIAWATGGASEIILMPADLYRNLNSAADAKMAATNRDLTAAEATWEVTKAVLTEYLTGKIGRALGKAPEPNLPRINRLKRTYMPEVAPPPPNIALRALKPGDVIPPQILHQAGYTPEHLAKLAKFSKQRNVVVAARTTNPYSLSHLRGGTAIPKPLHVKSKSISDLDVLLGANPQHRGTVGMFKPELPDAERMSRMSKELADQVKDRFATRMKDFNKNIDMPIGREAAEAAGSKVYREGGRVFDTSTGKAFAGDMDMVYLKDANTGELIRGDRLRDLAAEMQDLGLAEHGVELEAVTDILRAKGLNPGDAGWREAFDEVMDLRQNLEGATVFGNETVVEMGTDGLLSMGPGKTELMGMY